MKRFTRYFIFATIVVLFTLALPGKALAASQATRIVIGETLILESGETLNDDLFIIGGTVILEKDSLVEGDILVLGGTLSVDGEVDGDIVGAGGFIELDDDALIHGNIGLAGAHLDQDTDAIVEGEVRSEIQGPFNVTVPDFVRSPFPPIAIRVNPFFEAGMFFLQVVFLALIAMGLVMFFPTQTGRVASTIVSQPLISGGLGLLTIIVAPVVLVLLVITILGIPISLLLALVLAVAWAFGLIALGMELGNRLAQIFNQEWHPALAAGVGTFFLALVINGIDAIGVLDCIDWLPKFLAGVLGLGGVLLTRFGTQSYIPATAAPSAQVPTIEPSTPTADDIEPEPGPTDEASADQESSQE